MNSKPSIRSRGKSTIFAIMTVIFIGAMVFASFYMYKLGYKNALEVIRKSEKTNSSKSVIATTNQITANIIKVIPANDPGKPYYIKDTFGDTDLLVFVNLSKKNLNEDEIMDLKYDLPFLQLKNQNSSPAIFRTTGCYSNKNETILVLKTKSSLNRSLSYNLSVAEDSINSAKWLIPDNILISYKK